MLLGKSFEEAEWAKGRTIKDTLNDPSFTKRLETVTGIQRMPERYTMANKLGNSRTTHPR